MKIALLCPSRERMNRKLTLLSSLLTTTHSPDNITLYFGVDADDPTREIVELIAKHVKFVKTITIPKLSNPPNIHKIWNYCAAEAMKDPENEVLALCADDFIFRTPRWDVKILAEFFQLPQNEIKLVTCNDTHKNGAIPVNYFVPRKYIDIVGYIARDDFIINWCDNWVKTTFLSLDRYVYRPDIVIEHNHWVFSGNGPDDIGKKMMEREQGSKAQSDDLWPKLEPERYKEVLKIADALGLPYDLKHGEFSEGFLKQLKGRGVMITKEEAYRGLGNPKTWESDAKKLMHEFKKKP